MRIAYLGAFAHTWATEAHVARDAETLGHTVSRITSTDPAVIEAECATADLVVCHRTGLPPAVAGVWERLASYGVTTASYHLDLYVGLQRERQILTDPFWRTHTVFTADGDPHTTTKLAALGVNHKWLPAAVVSDETDPGELDSRYDYDVVFVGAKRYHPEWPARPQLIDFLARRYGSRFRLFDHHPPTRGQDLNDLYATARVVVGDTLCLPGHTRFWSDRYYETIGRGGFLIAPWVPGIESHFGDHEHLVYYPIGDHEALAVEIDYYLDHQSAARTIADTGREHTKQWHTYRNRVQQLLAYLDLSVPCS